ncbi:DNA-directed RNA polymerase III subunit RPC10 [Colletotrichum sp. SAR 10_71]|nr:DNA-directed RNA polymerase III subunit RPC10 [Colletotrichum sp. SAR 10_71]
MLLFCPNCANILTVSAYAGVRNRLECRTCPFEHAITEPIYSRREFERKEREDVFGGPGEWDNADKARAQCPKDGCNGEEAAFFQVQIRSADEPMTTFFKALHDLRNEMERELRRALSLVYITWHCVATSDGNNLG